MDTGPDIEAVIALGKPQRDGTIVLDPEAVARLTAFVKGVVQENEVLRAGSVTDPLTGLYNKKGFDDLLEQTVARCRRKGEEDAAIVYMDVNYLKRVNDTFGHQVGDELLKCVGEALSGFVRSGDVAAHLSGDEFALIITKNKDDKDFPAAAMTRLENALNNLVLEILYEGKAFNMAVYMAYGAVCVSSHASVEEIKAAADEKMYENKNAGKARREPGHPIEGIMFPGQNFPPGVIKGDRGAGNGGFLKQVWDRVIRGGLQLVSGSALNTASRAADGPSAGPGG